MTQQDHQLKIDGIVIGVLMRVEKGVPFVVFPGNPSSVAVPARSVAEFRNADIGSEVALSFENGRADRPILLGRIVKPVTEVEAEVAVPEAEVQEIAGDRELTLRCGKASITLTRAGKIILRGTYISSRSSGMNRIKGGSVQLN